MKIKIFYDIVMSDKDPQTTKFNNEHHKYEKEAPITFADCEFLIKNLDGWRISPFNHLKYKK